MVRRFREFKDSIAGRATTPYVHNNTVTVPTLANFPDITDPTFYTYISEDTWNYIFNDHSFKLGTASEYRSTTNLGMKDEQEGIGVLCLTHRSDQLTVGITSGFNAAIYCGTGAIGDRALMSRRFGNKLIKIHPVREFAKRIADRIGAREFHIYDVVYNDAKNFIAEHKTVQRFPKIVMKNPGSSDLTPESLHGINKRFFELFHQIGRMPSLFLKPIYPYALERERRIIFEFGADVKKDKLIFTDRSLLEFIACLSS
jgi:hypothetical protein